MVTSGRGQVLLPWPNRLEDGGYEFDGRRHQLPLTEPTARNAIHGLVRWVAWTRRRARAGPGRDGAHAPSAAGLPVPARTRASSTRSPTTACGSGRRATNVGAAPCPYGAGAHPYLTLGHAHGRPARPARPGRAPCSCRTSAASRPARAASRARSTTSAQPRPIGATVLDNAFTDLERDDDGLARVVLRASRRRLGAHAVGGRGATAT